MNKLTFCNRNEAIARMNRLGKERTRFFFLINFDETECLVSKLDDIPAGQLAFIFPEIANVCSVSELKPENIFWKAYPQPYEEYLRSFDIVHRNLYAGNSFLTNLTCATPVETNLSLYQVFLHATARYKLWYDDRFVVFSPETFVRIKEGYIYSFPMKGTIDASLPDAKEVLLRDEKEAAEHATITDLIRNDLSRVASEVTVTRYRYLDELHTHCGRLLQMSSESEGVYLKTITKSWGRCSSNSFPPVLLPVLPRRKRWR